MLSATPIKSEKAVNDLLALAEMITKPDVFKQHMTQLKALQTETNQALAKLTKAKSIDQMLQAAKETDRKAKQHKDKATKEATKILKDAETKAREQLQAANEHAQQVRREHNQAW